MFRLPIFLIALLHKPQRSHRYACVCEAALSEKYSAPNIKVFSVDYTSINGAGIISFDCIRYHINRSKVLDHLVYIVIIERKLHDMEKKSEPAYFTVEASLILPMVFLFTTMMIFLAFYSYNRCIMEQSAYEAALRGSGNHFKTAGEAYQAAENAAGRLVDGKLFALQNLTHQVTVTADYVTVSYSGTVNMPLLSWLGEYVTDLDFFMKVTSKAKRCRPTKTIRGIRILNHLIPQ